MNRRLTPHAFNPSSSDQPHRLHSRKERPARYREWQVGHSQNPAAARSRTYSYVKTPGSQARDTRKANATSAPPTHAEIAVRTRTTATPATTAGSLVEVVCVSTRLIVTARDHRGQSRCGGAVFSGDGMALRAPALREKNPLRDLCDLRLANSVKSRSLMVSGVANGAYKRLEPMAFVGMHQDASP
jgi:hypothetical protein